MRNGFIVCTEEEWADDFFEFDAYTNYGTYEEAKKHREELKSINSEEKYLILEIG